MKIPQETPSVEQARREWVFLLTRLHENDRQDLQREVLTRLWRARLLRLRRIPAPLKLGGSYSTLAFLAMVLVPLPLHVPLFVPLLITAAGCLALCLVAAFDLVLGLCIQRLQPQVPALALEPAFAEQVSFVQAASER